MPAVKKILLTGAVISALAQPALAARTVYVYIIRFENLQNDPAVEWLGDGFMDMLNTQLAEIDAVRLRDQNALEEVMNNRRLLLQQPRDAKNFLILGKYSRSLNRIAVDVQMIDIATWEEVDRRKVSGIYAAIAELNSNLGNLVQTMLTPYLPKPQARLYPELKTPRGAPSAPKYLDHSSEVSKSMVAALDELEEKMDLTIGAREEVPSGGVREEDDEWILDLGTVPSGKASPENVANTRIMLQVLDELMASPYQVILKRPRFEYDPDDRERMHVNLPVTYSIKANIVKDMLSSLPYSGLKQAGSLTIFYFNKDKFNFQPALTDKIRFGRYRTVPVVRLFDQEGQVMAVIVDTPEARWHERSSSRVVYHSAHHFAPLIDFTIGGWSLQVALENVNIPVEYRFTMDLDQTRTVSRVSVKFVPETELDQFLDRIL